MGFWLGKVKFLALVKVTGAQDEVLVGRSWVSILCEGGWKPG
jgi:hypothetical protein